MVEYLILVLLMQGASEVENVRSSRSPERLKRSFEDLEVASSAGVVGCFGNQLLSLALSDPLHRLCFIPELPRILLWSHAEVFVVGSLAQK